MTHCFVQYRIGSVKIRSGLAWVTWSTGLGRQGRWVRERPEVQSKPQTTAQQMCQQQTRSSPFVVSNTHAVKKTCATNPPKVCLPIMLLEEQLGWHRRISCLDPFGKYRWGYSWMFCTWVARKERLNNGRSNTIILWKHFTWKEIVNCTWKTSLGRLGTLYVRAVPYR